MEQVAEKVEDTEWPSGTWVGFWTEPNRPFLPYKNRMELDLFFSDGKVTGAGNDHIGNFSISGSYDTGDMTCTWSKSYTSHRVDYRGHRDGRGIYGSWKVVGEFGSGATHGGFHIWPKGIAEAEIAKLVKEKETPETVQESAAAQK